MTGLTTTHLQRLLDQAAPGPWEARGNYLDGDARPDDSYQIRAAAGDYLGIMHGQDAHLAAHAPELAQEVLRMRRELESMHDAWLRMAGDPEFTPTEQILAAQVVDHIRTVLRDHHDEQSRPSSRGNPHMAETAQERDG